MSPEAFARETSFSHTYWWLHKRVPSSGIWSSLNMLWYMQAAYRSRVFWHANIAQFIVIYIYMQATCPLFPHTWQQSTVISNIWLHTHLKRFWSSPCCYAAFTTNTSITRCPTTQMKWALLWDCQNAVPFIHKQFSKLSLRTDLNFAKHPMTG